MTYRMNKESKDAIKQTIGPLFSADERAKIKQVSKDLKVATEKYVQHIETSEGKAELEAFRRKHGTLTSDELNQEFTI